MTSPKVTVRLIPSYGLRQDCLIVHQSAAMLGEHDRGLHDCRHRRLQQAGARLSDAVGVVVIRDTRQIELMCGPRLGSSSIACPLRRTSRPRAGGAPKGAGTPSVRLHLATVKATGGYLGRAHRASTWSSTKGKWVEVAERVPSASSQGLEGVAQLSRARRKPTIGAPLSSKWPRNADRTQLELAP
jgi:hypothetical protein